jgi:hypothetical protein
MFSRNPHNPYPKYIEKDITICLHGGSDRDIVNRQMELLKPLEDEFTIHWNNRIDRRPEAYDSYSELVNEAVATSPTETVVLVNDRVVPDPKEVLFMLQMIHRGYAVASQWNVAYMALTKEVFRKIGWFDQRFYGGGCEDDDFVLRLRLANLAYYESLSCEYDQTWKSPLIKKEGAKCAISGTFFHQKWAQGPYEIKRVIPEETYEKWDSMIGECRPDISNAWLDWSHSIVGIDFGRRSTDGESRTYHFMMEDYKTEYRKVTSV